MVIDEDVLLKNGAEFQKYAAGETILLQESLPRFYFQISSGLVKLNTFRDDGSEIIYSLPSDGHCFAETFLWHDVPYCINAVAMNDTEIIKLAKGDFMEMVSSNSELMKNLMGYTAERMFYRYKMLDILSLNNPSRRIYEVLTFLKLHHKVKEPFKYIVPFTRQQLANITGLRVETVVRTIKKLEKEKRLIILKGKICL
ncbi:MAG: Crp/Fnr family transcriptional regulator [Chryseobacterium sp.]|uniref:Crp/Fnr family transcriptional regulator n=1 Tax=Chryseobacterium sp. TaxID=1871047 RepID=UPI0025C2A35E|nr:Crp/Fnr family transcriptional regulator [Chryseobacterium sp.]MCJ7932327.1 Crp/Fnr family transcriptional regulator [Chryseobacterium sp.]